MSHRKTASDYRKAHQDLVDKTKALEARIKARLKELITAHPDAVVGCHADREQTPIKANSLNSEYYLNGMSIGVALTYIETIETYLADQHPHQQGKLFKTDNNSYLSQSGGMIAH